MKVSILVALLSLTVAAMSAAAAQSSKTERTIVGYITDSMCGLDHSAMKMGDDKECTIKCVEGGAKYAFVDQAHKVVYFLDDATQPKAREFAGQKVKITGRVDAKARTVFVTKIAPAV